MPTCYICQKLIEEEPEGYLCSKCHHIICDIPTCHGDGVICSLCLKDGISRGAIRKRKIKREPLYPRTARGWLGYVGLILILVGLLLWQPYGWLLCLGGIPITLYGGGLLGVGFFLLLIMLGAVIAYFFRNEIGIPIGLIGMIGFFVFIGFVFGEIIIEHLRKKRKRHACKEHYVDTVPYAHGSLIDWLRE